MHSPRISNIFNAALNLAMLDGGFVIAIQIIDFLLNYFGASLFGSNQAIEGFSRGHLIASLLSILNISVIITRITGLTRGVRLSPAVCYEHSIRRWPLLILLYMVGSLLLLGVSVPLVKMLSAFGNFSIPQYSKIVMLLVFSLIPYGLFACIFVVDQAQNPLLAIRSTFNLIRHKLNASILFTLSLLYSLPLYFGSLLATDQLATYFALFSTLWLLFCHLITLIIYVSASEQFNPPSKDKQSTAKVIIA